MRRVLLGAVSLYLLFAVIGRFVEGMGGGLRMRTRLLVQEAWSEHLPVGLPGRSQPRVRLLVDP